MWSVEFESVEVECEVKEMITSGELSESDSVIIATWIRQVTFYGPDSIRGDNKWADHELSEGWEGYRSSAFSNKGRIIYKIEDKIVKIFIARITVSHNYRKKEHE